MSEKLKCSHADVAHDLKRDAVVAAAIALGNSHGFPGNDVVRLKAAVNAYCAFASSVDIGPRRCAQHDCRSPSVCERHGHCFASEAH